jgi:hypothetical protein
VNDVQLEHLSFQAAEFLIFFSVHETCQKVFSFPCETVELILRRLHIKEFLAYYDGSEFEDRTYQDLLPKVYSSPEHGSCIQLLPLSRQYFLAGADICETNTFSGAFFLQATTTLSNADFLYTSYDISFYLSHDALFFISEQLHLFLVKAAVTFLTF